MEKFEKKLKDFDYEVKYLNESCDHSFDQGQYFIYFQQCTCCVINPKEKVRSMKEIEFEWYRDGPFCEDCFNSYMGILFCGGHYSNLRYFKDNMDISETSLNLEPDLLLVDSKDYSQSDSDS